MAGNRKKAEALALERIDALMPGSKNKELWAQRFSEMSDTQFAEFVADIKTKKKRFAIIAENMSNGPKLSTARNLELGEKWGHNFFQRVWFDNGIDPPYLSNVPYLVIDWTLRRQAQLLPKKLSVPEDNKSIDDLTGQPTGKSKGSKISGPEMGVLASHNLDNMLTELMKMRGGDVDAFNAMNNAISKTGYVRLEPILEMGTTVRSTETFSAYLTGMHLSNTLLKTE